MTSGTLRPARVATLALLAIETLALYGWLLRGGPPPIRLAFYSPRFVPLALALAAGWVATLYFVWRPSARICTQVSAAARWLRARPWWFALLAYCALEGWYALIRMVRHEFMPGTARRPFMTAILLILIWAMLVGLLAGRTRDQRRKTAAALALSILSALVTFWLASYVLVRVFNFKDSGDGVHAWGDLLRYDYRLGYTGKPNLQDYQPPNCPQEAQGVTYFTDGQGFRNPPGAGDAPLVVVGSSYAFGVCQSYEDMWSTQLAGALDTEAANYSVPSVGLWYYNAYTDDLVRAGDHAVLIYTMTLWVLRSEPLYDHSLYNRLATNGILYYMSPLNYTISQYLTTSPATQVYRAISGPHDEPQPPTTVTLPNGVVLDETGGIYSQYLGPESIVGVRLAQAMTYADEMDMPFVVVMIPSKRSAYHEAYAGAFPQSASLTERENAAYERICEWLTERGALCYNLTHDMRRAAAEESALYFSTDGHWNPEGSRLAAGLVADYLRANLPQDTLDALHAGG